jgi:hypothetical protein
MTQPTLLELAKQGDEKAIISVMNYLLKDKGITAKAAQKDDCLLVVLKSDRVANQKSSVAFIHKLMMKLGVESIKSVKVYGKQTGKPSPAWMQSIDLTHKVEEPKKQTSPLESLLPGNLKAIALVPKLNVALENYQSRRSASRQKPQKLVKKLLIILLIPLAAVGVYLFSQLPEIKETIPVPVAYQAPSVTPTPVTSASPASSPQPNSFREAVNKAMSAATITQSAKSKDDWNLVASQWQEAIALMKAVPASSPNYALAQKKVVEYQPNLDYALSAASRAK